MQLTSFVVLSVTVEKIVDKSLVIICDTITRYKLELVTVLKLNKIIDRGILC
jgi:hypothetical protein